MSALLYCLLLPAPTRGAFAVGLLRFYLALSVMLFHIGGADWIPVVPAGAAVFCFFILSGFYIALGLNERYASADTNRLFYASRVIRLWPVYLLSLVFVAMSGTLMQTVRAAMDLPPLMAAIAFVSNLTLIGLDSLTHLSAVDGRIVFSEYGFDPKHNGANYILNFPAWSLGAEMLFYLVAPFVARSFMRALIFLLVGMAYMMIAGRVVPTLAVPFNMVGYFPCYMIFFGLGMTAYWLSRRYPSTARWPMAAACIAIGAAAYLLMMRPEHFSLGYLCLALATPAVFRLTQRNPIDNFFGDLAYPIYILHVPVAMLLRSTDLIAPTPVATFAVVMIASVLALLLIDAPIERLKYRWLNTRHVPVKV